MYRNNLEIALAKIADLKQQIDRLKRAQKMNGDSWTCFFVGLSPMLFIPLMFAVLPAIGICALLESLITP